MRHKEDQDTIEAIEKQKKSERKNYTYRLEIYLAELFAEVCAEKGVQPVVLLENWMKDYTSQFEEKYGPEILSEIGDIIKTKKQNEKKSRLKQKRKRG
jgi:hypothetical protein